MGIFSPNKSKLALERYRNVTNNLMHNRKKAAKQSCLRKGLRLEKLNQRVVFSGASAIAVNDLYDAMMDEPLQVEVGGVLANDTDAEGDTLTASEFFAPKNGELVLNEDGTFTYQPDPGFTGVDGFVYQASDGTSQSSLAAVTINVSDPNVAPEGANDFFSIEEDGVLNVIAENGVLINDKDENGDPLSVEIMNAPDNGTVELQSDGSFVYTPSPDFSGTDAFTYQLNDGALKSDLIVVELEVVPVNDAPEATGESFTVDEDSVLEISQPELGLLANDSDMEASELTVMVESLPEYGQLDLQENGTFQYTPDPNYYGTDSFSYRVSDGDMESEVVSVEIMVNAVHDAPVASNDFFAIQEDSVLEVSQSEIFENDNQHDAPELVAELVDLPQHGVVEFNEDGTIRYSPGENFNGTDAFTYRLEDSTQPSELAVVEIMVDSVNDAPVAQDDAFATESGTPLTIGTEALLQNDMDIDGDELSVTASTDPEFGSLEINDDGNLIYTPNEGFVGEDQFSYEVSDGVETSIAFVTIAVNAPVVPETANESYDAEGGSTLVVDAVDGLLANEQREGDLEVVLFRGPNNGELALNADGSFEFTPDEEFEGIDSILYRTTDGETESRLGVATIHVANMGESEIEQPIADGNQDPDPTPPIEDIATDGEGEADPEETENDHSDLDCWDSVFADIERFWFDMRSLFA